MGKRYFLGLDNGGTMTKAAILDMEAAGITAVTGVKTEMLFPAADRTEKDFESVWLANLDVVRRVLASSGIDAREIGGIAITGHGNGLYLADAAGKQVHNGIVSTDTRADAYAERCRVSGRFAKGHPRTMQSIWGAQPPMLLQWFQDNAPDVLDRARYIFMLKDLIRFRMTGEAFSEKTELSGAHLLNNREGRLDDAILENFDILGLKGKIPPLKDSHDCCGGVTREAAEASGLVEGTPVYGGIFDINACCIASGVTDSTLASVIGGTWSINQYISRAPVMDHGLFMDSLYCIPGWHLVTEASPTGASNLEWFVSNLLPDARELSEQRGESIFAYCERQIAASSPDTGVLFVPFIFGSHSSGVGSACFLGLRSFHKHADLVRAVYEGVAFSHRYHMERLRAFGDSSETIRLSGGAARSRVWLQMFADIIGRPVETVHGEELGVMGTLMSALVGSGVCRDYQDAVRRLVRVKERVEPNPSLAGGYHEKFERYKKAVGVASGWV